MKDREQRRCVLVPARMRAGAEWADVLIQNVSSRGMMMQSLAPPVPGTYIEVRKAALTLVARVVWLKGQQFGVRLQDRLNFEDLVRSAKAGLETLGRGYPRGVERRRDPALRAVDLASRVDRSRHLSATLQFITIVAMIAVAAGIVGSTMSLLMAAPMQTVIHTLAAGS